MGQEQYFSKKITELINFKLGTLFINKKEDAARYRL